MAAPTFVASYPVTSFVTAAASKSVSVPVNSGDVLAVVGICPDQAVTMATPSDGVNTYTNQQEVNVASYTRVAMWTATATTTTTLTVSITRGGSNFMWGFTVLRFSGVSSIGASTKTNVTSGAPSLALTTLQANSAIVVANGDWAPVDGASRVWRTPSGSTAISEQSYAYDASNYTAYVGYHSDAGAAGAKTVGLSAPTGQKYSIVALEIEGVTGQTVSPTGVASVAAVGSPTLTVGAVTVIPTGIGPVAAVGSPVVANAGSPATIIPSGVASAAAVGAPALTAGVVAVSPTGITPPGVLGAPTLTAGPIAISPPGISSAAQVSSPVVAGGATRWRLVNPKHVEAQYVTGSLTYRLNREETVFGDDVLLLTAYQGSREIPFGTKYIWYGGHQNTTGDTAIRDLWLANGFTVEAI